ncbi:hypothetical protein EYC84_004889 [Monilinia fructicola]|nr:hypothetical protein EYC84_004889 [Monilinia fructicola]
MPPPIYDPSAPMPPTYQPPAGATKVDPSQWRSQPTRRPADDGGESAPNYEAPPGPPPNLQTNNTGASNNPFRVNSAAKGVGLLDKIELSRRSHWRSMDYCTIRNRQEQ